VSDLSTVAKVVNAFYRLTGEESGDQEMEYRGEETDEVAYTYLTRGCRTAQRWMISMGYGGWRKRSDALSWSGTDGTTGGTYSDVPDDFLRAYGNKRRSALVKAGGDRWGREIDPEDDHLKGDLYYVRGEELWLGRTATPPSPLYLDYHYRHPVWASDTTIDFPLEAMTLIPAKGAVAAMDDNWLPGGPEMEQKILRAEIRAENEARDIARATKNPRTFRKPARNGNRR